MVGDGASNIGTFDAESILALSSAKASQNALWVTKLSFLEKRVPQSHLYSLVPQVLV